MENKFEIFVQVLAGFVIAYMLISLFYLYVAVGQSWKLVWLALLDNRILGAVWISISTAFIVGFLAILLGIPVGYVLAFKEFRGKSMLETLLIDMPQTFPPVTEGLVYLLLFSNFDLAFTYTAVIIAKFYVSAPFTISFITRRFKEIKQSGYDMIARSLGAERHTILFHILLPLSKSDLFAGFALTWARAMGELAATLVFAGAIPWKTETIPSLVYDASKNNTQMALAASVVGETLSLIALILFKKIAKKPKTQVKVK